MTNPSTAGSRNETATGLQFRHPGTQTVDSEAALTALNDPDCRELLEVATDEPRTAAELIEACSIPRSTAYRKIDLLTEAGLFEEGIRIRTDGKHASEYRRAVEEITVSLSTDDGVEIGAGAAAPACD
ncbi:winged helix-turn-helix domain-containing protein [Natronomonas marina]|jgi:DNA-binding transcriptional ArsR family regulator|uniref:winged helix-turn-helix domain-containing protein n=1 Tax=Natronomonas marina TaxID=2961939 RepID=UPI0020C9E2C5|nr:helix-turn-helix domain-containing protein [Natronomonas marina]